MRVYLSRGFTLIELLVVISIIGMLSSVVFVSVQSARDKGRIAAGLTFATHNLHLLGADAIGFWNFDQTTVCRKGFLALCIPDALGGSLYLKTFANNSLQNLTSLNGYLSSDTTLRKGSSGVIDSSHYFAHTSNSQLDAYVDSSNLRPKKITVSAWINLASAAPSGTIVNVISINDPYGSNDIGSVGAIWLDSDKFACQSDMMSGGYVSFGTQRPGMWQQITCSFDGVTGKVTAYFDGKKAGEGQFTFDSNFFNTYGSIQSIGIGTAANADPAEQPDFTGLIDDVAVYAGSL